MLWIELILTKIPIMKNFRNVVLALIVFLLTASPALSQDEVSSPRFSVKTNPLAALGGPFWIVVLPVTGEYKVLFEAKTMQKQSVTLGTSYIGPSLLLNLDELTSEGEDISGIKTSGFRIQGMYKFYLTSESQSLEGLYVGPHFSYASASIASKDDTADKIDMMKMNLNGVIGYQLVSSGGFALDIYTGIGVKSRKWTFSGQSDQIFDIDIENKASASVAFGLSFGYAF